MAIVNVYDSSLRAGVQLKFDDLVCGLAATQHLAYTLAKSDHSSFSHSGDVVGAHQNLNGSRDLTMPL